MAATTGRAVLITWDSVDIAARTKTITINGAPIDVSDDRSDGWREVLATSVDEKGMNIAIEGLYKGSDLRLKNNTEGAATITMPGSEGTITGQFVLTGFELQGEYKEATKFTAELHSTGVVTQAADTP